MPAARPIVFSKELALRIGERIGRGVPLRHACNLEGDERITVESYQRALERNAILRGIHEAAVAEFVDSACERLSKSDPASLRFILERRHPADFGRTEIGVQNNTLTINGMSRDLVSNIRDLARKRMAGRKQGKPAGEVLDVEAVATK